MITKDFRRDTQIRLFQVFVITSLVGFMAFSIKAMPKIPVSNKTQHTFTHSDSLEMLINQDILVLQRYGGEKRKWVKKGTMMKVYLVPFLRDSLGTSSDKSFLSGKDVYRGKFESLIGDTLTLVRSGKALKFDIDNLYQLKVYNEVGARVFGDMVNLASIVGFGYSGLLFGLGAAWTREDEPFASAVAGPLMIVGVALGGLSYLVHRLGLVIRRNKYNLMGDWYIVRSI